MTQEDRPASPRRRLPAGDPLASALEAALAEGDAEQLIGLLAEQDWLARCLIEDAEGNVIAPLHVFADAPGHRPRAAPIVNALVAAGADVDDQAIGSWHEETALHWAASNDDVELIDALLDAGADIERPGSSINGGPPLESAVGYGQWLAARRLVTRGATVNIFVAAALGLMPDLRHFLDASPPPQDLSGALWNAARSGQQSAAALLLERGAEINWPAPWSGETPLDAARAGRQAEMATWLIGKGAVAGTVDRATGRPIS